MTSYEPRQTFTSMANPPMGRSAAVPKTLSYMANGTGRDNYIGVNNGGLTVGRTDFKAPELGTFHISKIKYRDVHPLVHAKDIKYQSDGSGRDSYVVTSSGGLYTETRPGSFKDTYYNSLRSYNRSTSFSPTRTAYSKEPFSTTHNFTSTKHHSQMNTIHKYQLTMDERLSKPKHIKGKE